MTKKEIGQIFYSMYIHTYLYEYDVLKYDYNVPKFKEKDFERFMIQNKFNLDKFLVYNKKNIILYAILNNLYKPSLEIDTTLNLKDFFRDIIEYKNYMSIDVTYLLENVESIEDIYLAYKNKKIKFYTFYYVIKYLKFDKPKYIVNDLFKMKLKHSKKIHMILDFKDTIKHVKNFEDLQKKIDFLILN